MVFWKIPVRKTEGKREKAEVYCRMFPVNQSTKRVFQQWFHGIVFQYEATN